MRSSLLEASRIISDVSSGMSLRVVTSEILEGFISVQTGKHSYTFYVMEPLFCIKSKPMVLNREPLGSVSENFEILYAQAILEFPNLPGLSGDDTQLRTVMQQC